MILHSPASDPEVAVTGPMVRAILAASTAFERHRYARDRDPGSNCSKPARQVCLKR